MLRVFENAEWEIMYLSVKRTFSGLIILSLSTMLEAQTLPLSEGLFQFEGDLKQKVVRLSERVVTSLKFSSSLLHTVYYNAPKDRILPHNQGIRSVTWIYKDRAGSVTSIPLLDDGIHFDNGIGDSIYANSRNANDEELNAEELIVDIQGDSLGALISVLFPPMVVIPNPPRILFPWNGATLSMQSPVITWQIDKRADGGSLLLVEAPFTFGRKPGPILWQAEHQSGPTPLLSDTVNVGLSPNRTYCLLAWSYVRAKGSIEGKPQNEAFSFEMSTFSISETFPVVFALNDIYPNPFHQVATISWSQAFQQDVTISIYDLVGREVTQFVAYSMSAGQHAIFWDGSDSRGHRAPSGVYFLRVATETDQRIAKLVLLH